MASSSAATVARASFFLMVAKTLNIPVSLVALAFFARTLPLTDMGIVVGFGILVGFLQVVSDPGLTSAIIRYSAEATGSGRNASVLVRKMTTIGAGIAAIVSLSFLAVGVPFSNSILRTHVPPDLSQVLSVEILLACLAPYMEATLVGLRDFKHLSLARISSNWAGKLAGIALVAAGLGVKGVVLGWVLGDATFVIQTLFAIGHDLRTCSSFPPLVVSNRELCRFTFPAYASGLIDFGSSWYDKIFVLVAFPLERLAAYGVASSIFSFASGWASVVSVALFPHFAEQYGRQGETVLRNEGRDAARYMSLIFTPFFLGLAAISSPAIALVAGPKYEDASIILAMLCAFGGLTVSSLGFDQIFYVMKRTEVYVLTSIATGGGGLLLTLILAGPFGILGIAVARGITFLVAYAIEFWSLRVLLSLRLDVASLSKILLCGLTMAAMVWGIQQAWYSVQLLGVYILIGAALYFGLVRQMRVLRRRDFHVTRELVGSRFRHVVDAAEKVAWPKRI